MITISYILLCFLTNALSSPVPLPIAWGFATSAYQIEGAWNVDGKSPSVWDKWYLDPSRANSPNGFIADDHYNRMKSDIAYLGLLNSTAYRFSIAWTRILPNCSGSVNMAGIKFYSDMIDEMLKHGVLPVLTFYHWDTPQSCHDQYGSWGNMRIVEDFTNYVDVILNAFGDRVQYYLTINEPSAECGWGYGDNFWPPGVKGGEPLKYLCQHYTNLAHGSAVQMARRKYPTKNFKFGMPLIIGWAEPNTNTPEDIAASGRSLMFASDWNWGPLVNGDYSDLLKNDRIWGPLLPTYTEEQKAIMKGTMDFAAFNYYSASYASNSNDPADVGGFKMSTTRNDVLIGPVSGTPWQNIYTPGLRNLTKWVHDTYKMDIFITECGVSIPNEANMSVEEAANDQYRINFFNGIFEALSDSILYDKTPVKAFLAWALMDNFEWNNYDQTFGVIHIDRAGGTLNRTLKNSARFIQGYFSNAVSPFSVKRVVNGSSGASSDNPKTGNNEPSKNEGYSMISSIGILIFLNLILL